MLTPSAGFRQSAQWAADPRQNAYNDCEITPTSLALHKLLCRSNRNRGIAQHWLVQHGIIID
jgi:hypothetical protein